MRRDYKRLREVAGWRSSMIVNENSEMKDLLGGKFVVKKNNGSITKQKQVTQRPFTTYFY